jgi:hypothetical protein
MTRQLRKRIGRLLAGGTIVHEKERQKLDFLLNTKWNPYCVRHSAITFDSDFLPEYLNIRNEVTLSFQKKDIVRPK